MSKLENEQSQLGYTNNFIDTAPWIPDRRKSCLCLHKEAHGDGRMAQLVKCLPRMHENTHLILSTQINMDTVVHTCNPSIMELETSRSLGFADQPVLPNWWAPDLLRYSALNKGCPATEKVTKSHPLDLGPPYARTIYEGLGIF